MKETQQGEQIFNLEPTEHTFLNLVITAADTELGQEITRQLVARGHQVTGLALNKNGAAIIHSNGGLPTDASLTNASELKDVFQAAKANVVLNLVPQFPNTFSKALFESSPKGRRLP